MHTDQRFVTAHADLNISMNRNPSENNWYPHLISLVKWLGRVATPVASVINSALL